MENQYVIVKNENVTDEILNQIILLDQKLYPKKYLWNKDYQKMIYQRNKYSIISILFHQKLVGYINYLVISKEKYEEIKKSNTTVDTYQIEEILPFQKHKQNYITLNSVVVDKMFQNGVVIQILTRELKKQFQWYEAQGYSIFGFSAVAVSLDGRKFLERMGFTLYKELEDHNATYIMEKDSFKKYVN